MLKKTLNLFYVALWIFAVLPIGLSAQNLKKGYKLLEKADYEKALKLVKDEKEKERLRQELRNFQERQTQDMPQVKKPNTPKLKL
jgi:hypothetical protein